MTAGADALQISATNRVPPANAGEHFPERVENAAHRRPHVVDVVIIDVTAEHLALSGRMLAVGFDVDAEIFVMFWIGEAVMLLQSIDLRFADRRDLTLVSVQRG